MIVGGETDENNKQKNTQYQRHKKVIRSLMDFVVAKYQTGRHFHHHTVCRTLLVNVFFPSQHKCFMRFTDHFVVGWLFVESVKDGELFSCWDDEVERDGPLSFPSLSSFIYFTVSFCVIAFFYGGSRKMVICLLEPSKKDSIKAFIENT